MTEKSSPPSAAPPAPQKNPVQRGVERLFPFVLRTRTLLVGRDKLRHNKSRLHFVLITRDISENARAEVLQEFKDYPVVQCFTSADLEKFFGITGAKAVGLMKSSLAQSIYRELKEHRVNPPAKPVENPLPHKDKVGVQTPARPAGTRKGNRFRFPRARVSNDTIPGSGRHPSEGRVPRTPNPEKQNSQSSSFRK